MSATATRPPDQRNPMIDEDDLTWLCFDGIYLGIPNDAPDGTIRRALAALEWMSRQGECEG